MTLRPRHEAQTDHVEGIAALEAAIKPRLRGVVHTWAIAPMALAGLVLVIFAASTEARVAAGVYVLAITGMLAASACYHRLPLAEHSRRWLRRLDHSMIGVAVAGTYTPVVALVTTGALQASLLGVLWTGAAGAMAVTFLWPHASNALRAGLYVGLGWAGAAVLPWLWREGGPLALALVLAGAALYSSGAVVYARHKPDPWPHTFGFHEVFHTLVIAAVIAHFAAVAVIIDRAA